MRLTVSNKARCETGCLLFEFLVGTLNTGQSCHGGLTDAYSEEQGKVWIILVLVNHCDKRRAGLDWLGSVLYEIGGHVGGAGVALTAHHHRGQGPVWILGLSSLFAHVQGVYPRTTFKKDGAKLPPCPRSMTLFSMSSWA